MSVLCLLGRHDWKIIEGTEFIEFISKYQIYEHAHGYCTRCGTDGEIQKEIWY